MAAEGEQMLVVERAKAEEEKITEEITWVKNFHKKYSQKKIP